MLYNNAIQIKRDIIYRTAKSILKNDFESLNRIPLEAAPRGRDNIRCCIHKDRAVLKYRVMAALGYSIEDETDELKTLSSYAKEITVNDEIDERVLTIIHDACRSCKLGHHYISDVCVGCVARPCTSVCPKNAISVNDSRSVIDKNLCIDCGKCTSVCPYNAVVKIPVPCEVSCPVDALKKGDNNIAEIDLNKCIFCGKCIKSCPFGAISEKSQLSTVIKLLQSNKKINALIAPSIAGQFPGNLNQIKSAICGLGYNDVIDVADAAAIVAEEEATEYIKKGDTLTSSCCPSYISCIEKHTKNVEDYVSNTLSPMALSGDLSKKNNPGVINVFIGPCLSKKVEALKSDVIDYVLTFEELGAHFMAAQIDTLIYPEDSNNKLDKTGYGFATTGGVLNGVRLALRDKDIWIKGETLNGLDKRSIRKLKGFKKIFNDCDFLEVMSCEGGCLNGPGVIVSPEVSKKALEKI
ncbi:MAG: monomeric [FeFe] hydrogenase [Spirochaetaceae bacterium]